MNDVNKAKAVTRVGWRYLLHHPWQGILMILGIALGVAVVVSIDLANASASRAFDLSTEAVAGKATHQIIGGPAGLDQQIYVDLKTRAIQSPLAPVIQAYVVSDEIGGYPLQLLGVDPFADAPFRDYLGSPDGESRTRATDLSQLLTSPGAILISDQLAEQFGLSIGQNIILEIAGRREPVHIAGFLTLSDELSRRALNGILLADISTTQELLGRENTIDNIDVILPEGEQGEELAAEITQQLSGRAILQPVAARSGAVQQMTAAFRLNLAALSLLALVVGMFLIYNTVTFSVVQRRPLFGTLRCLGVTRSQVFGMVMSEAFFVGLAGSGLGLILGVLMGRSTVGMIAQTINDLFFVVNVQGGAIAIESLVKGGILGMSATLLSTLPPAWEAASVSPRAALSRSSLESKARAAIVLAFWIGLLLILVGCLMLLIPSRSLLLSFISTLAVVVGFAMLVPRFTGLFTLYAAPIFEKLLGLLGRMAPRDVQGSLSRTAIAVMALMVAVSVTIGVSLMVNSFRFTVITWLNETLQGDIYISAPSLTATTPSESIDPEILELTSHVPGVERVDVLRSATVNSPQGAVNIAATDNYSIGFERIFITVDGEKQDLWDGLLSGAVIVSEPFADRMDLPMQGGMITLITRAGPRQFPVMGVYYDYASVAGTVIMALPVYQEFWDDREITAVQLRLNPGIQVDGVVKDLQEAFAPIQGVRVQANQILKQEVLKIFDRTFLITGALQVIATVVAFIGILSALLSLELERQRELGILRSIGMTVGQVRVLLLSETGLMGAIAGVLAMPAGYVLAVILVYIINKRSFGWTLQMHIDPVTFLEALGIALTAAVLAGIYPAFRIGKINPSEALRSE